MKRVAQLLLLFAVQLCFGTGIWADDVWHAGSAKINITPDQYMWMSGYASRTAPADGKITDLWAKALVLQDSNDHRAVLVTLDLVGIGRDMAQAITDRLEAEYGLARRQVALCVSHTHTGPVVKRNLSALHYLQLDDEQRRRVESYATVLEDKVVDVVGQAIENLAPSRLTWGSGTATFAVNRRNNKEADVPRLRVAGDLVGPSDHDVPVLAIYDSDDKLSTVVFGYACHSTVLALNQWSGDYPGFAQIELERTHPDFIAMFWAGCGGDQNPLPRRTVELAEHYGRRLAIAVDAVLMTTEMRPVASRLSVSYDEIAAPFDRLPTRDDLVQAAGSSDRYESARAKMLLEKVDNGQPLAATYPYPVALWRIGDEIELVFLGGEVVVDYAIRLKAELAGKRTWVAGYANDVMAYIPSRRVLAEGGYEGGGAMVYYGQPTIWAPEIENAIVAEVHRQIGK